MLLGVLQQIDQAGQVVLEQLAAAQRSLHSCQHARRLAAASITQSAAGRLSRSLAARMSPWTNSIPSLRRRARLVSEPGRIRLSRPRIARPSPPLEQCLRHRTAHESTDAGDENPHPLTYWRSGRSNQFCAISRKISSRLLGNAPGRVVRLHLTQIAVVADVVADAVLVHVAPVHGAARWRFPTIAKGFQNRTGVALAAAQVVDFGHARRLPEFEHEARHVLRVDVVAHLLALVTENLVLAALHVALDQVTQKTVQFHAGMVGPGEATAAQAAGRHVEIAAVFLHHHVAGHLGGAEERVLALIDGEILGNAVRVSRVGVIPAGFQFLQRNGIGPVAVDLVGGHVDERRSPGRICGPPPACAACPAR